MTKHGAFLDLASEQLEVITTRISDENGYFDKHDIDTLACCFEAFYAKRKIRPNLVLLLWGALTEVCRPGHSLVMDEAAKRHAELTAEVQKVVTSKWSHVEKLKPIAAYKP